MKILLVPKAFFGDIVLTTAVLSALKRSDPRIRISVLLPPAAVSLLAGHPDIDEVIPFDRRKDYLGLSGIRRMAKELRRREFTCAYSLQKSPRTALLLRLAGIPERIGVQGSKLGFLYTKCIEVEEALHEVLRAAQVVMARLSEDLQADWHRLALGEAPSQVDAFSLSLPVPARDAMSDRVMEILRHESPYIVLVPGSAWRTKRWSVEGFHGVAVAMLQEGYRVVLLGSQAERTLCEEVAGDLAISNLAGVASLPEMVRVIHEARGVVCNDSMALHVASSCKTPCVAVFCATSPKFGFGPWRNRAVVVEKEGLFCKPCRRHGSATCPVGTWACVNGVTSLRVVAALHEVLASDGVGSREIVV